MARNRSEISKLASTCSAVSGAHGDVFLVDPLHDAAFSYAAYEETARHGTLAMVPPRELVSALAALGGVPMSGLALLALTSVVEYISAEVSHSPPHP
jgi:hypothetical protein